MLARWLHHTWTFGGKDYDLRSAIGLALVVLAGVAHFLAAPEQLADLPATWAPVLKQARVGLDVLGIAGGVIAAQGRPLVKPAAPPGDAHPDGEQ